MLSKSYVFCITSFFVLAITADVAAFPHSSPGPPKNRAAFSTPFSSTTAPTLVGNTNPGLGSEIMTIEVLDYVLTVYFGGGEREGEVRKEGGK